MTATLHRSAAIAAQRRAPPVYGLSDFTADSWNGVQGHARTPMQQYIWALSAEEALSPDAPVEVVCVGDQERPEALAPLQRAAGPFGRDRLLGAEEIGEAIEVSARSEDAMRALAHIIARRARPVGFGHYPADGPMISMLKAAFQMRGVVVERPLPMRASPAIALDPSWRNPEGKLSSRRRADLRRMRRNAEKEGEVSFQFAAPGPTDFAPLLDEAIALEHKGWKGREGTSVAADPKLARFFKAYAARAARERSLRLSFLRIDGEPAAMQIAVETEGAYWLLKIAYDEARQRCAPGNLLICESIRRAAEKRLSRFEFLGKEASWTELWATSARPISALRAYPVNFVGISALAVEAAEFGARRLARGRGAQGRG